ncbi:MAG: septation protein A [Betaproteobacteria bacterium]|nr:septation protein A [Betaproteobacteria bacterium]
MKLLLDLLPVAIFFVAYKVTDIFVAAGVAIVIAILQIVWLLARRQPVKPVQWLSLGFLVIFGGATILLKDEFFIKVKWTFFYGLMSTLIFGALVLGKNPLKSLLGQELELPNAIWRQLSIAWGFFFLLLACLNQYFAMVLSLDAWVKVKVFGGTALSLVFVFAQAFWLAKHLPQESPTKDN